MATDSDLQASIETLAIPGVLIGHRLIAQGDELALLPDEQRAFANSVTKVQRASGAARIVARELMSQLGYAAQPILKSEAGVPIWPAGLVGSLAHSADVAIAALAWKKDVAGIGIDVEPAEQLAPDLLNLVATDNERRAIAADPYQGRLLFAIKEAVYKAVNPADGVFLEHHDVEVSFATSTAATRTGRTVKFRYALSSHIVAVAFI